MMQKPLQTKTGDTKPGVRPKPPQHINLGTFILSIEGLTEQDAGKLSRNFRAVVAKEFWKRNRRTLSLFYDLHLDEGPPWSGSRDSRTQASLNRKTNPLLLLAGALWFSLQFLSIDPAVVRRNLESAVKAAEQLFTSQGHKVSIKEIVPPRYI